MQFKKKLKIQTKPSRALFFLLFCEVAYVFSLFSIWDEKSMKFMVLKDIQAVIVVNLLSLRSAFAGVFMHHILQIIVRYLHIDGSNSTYFDCRSYRRN